MWVHIWAKERAHKLVMHRTPVRVMAHKLAMHHTLVMAHKWGRGMDHIQVTGMVHRLGKG